MSEAANRQVFEQVVRPHFPRLYRLAFRLTMQQAEAEDLFQELLIRAYGKLDELVHIDEPGSWLARVMYNLFIDERRRYARQRLHVVDESQAPGGDLSAMPGGEDPAASQARAERSAHLEAALAMLSEEHRLVVLLHDAEGYKLEEIHTITGVPVGTVKSRLHRARARLREILQPDGTFS